MVWIDNFVALLQFPIAFCADTSNHALRSQSLRLLARVCGRCEDMQNAPVVAHAEHILRAAVACLEDAYSEVQQDAVKTFRAALELPDATVVLRGLLAVLDAVIAANSKCLTFVLREVGAAYARGARVPATVALLPAVIKLLTGCFSNNNSEVRKTVVLNFVDLYQTLGSEQLLPRMTHLNVSQLKLISIYVNRQPGRTAPVDLCRDMAEMGLEPQQTNLLR